MKRGCFNFGRRGLSGVIVTLLLVMLAIVLVGVVFVVINNIVKTGSQQVASQSECLSSGIEVSAFSCTPTGSQCNVTIKRTSGNDAIGGVRVIFSNDAGDSNVSDFAGNIITLATKKVSASNTGISNVTTVEAAIYFTDASGNPHACSVTSQSTGAVGSEGTSYGGGSSGSSSGGSSGGGSSGGSGGTTTQCGIDGATISSLCGSYQCGSVYNGTCTTPVECGLYGGGCAPGSGDSCNLDTHQCIAAATCNPPYQNKQQLCGTYTCGDVNNGTNGVCGSVSCGSCGTNQQCDLSPGSPTYHQCISTTSCTPAVANYCTVNHYQCGTFNNNSCAGTINCATGTGSDGCNFPDFCNSSYKCQAPVLLNSGTIDSVWPPGGVRFFDSKDLNALTSGAGGSFQSTAYVRFPGEINDPNCSQVNYVLYQSTTDESFLSVSLAPGSYVNATSGKPYRIWNTYDGCISDTAT